MPDTLKRLRFALVVWIVATLLATDFAPVLAYPNLRDCSGGNAAIFSPASGATVGGIVQIEGTASLGGEFQYYKLEVAPMGTEAWGDLTGQAQQQVVNGQLGVWDSAAVSDGRYMLRLRVVDPTGNYCEAVATNIIVQNSRPTEVISPTPADTPTPTEAPPVQNAVPTPVPTTPPAQGTAVSATATPVRASPSRTPPPGSGGIGGIEIDQVVDAVTDFFSSLARVFIFGVLAMAAIFFFVGVVYFVRRVL